MAKSCFWCNFVRFYSNFNRFDVCVIIFFITLNLEDPGFMEVGLSGGLMVGAMFADVGGASGISKLLSRWWKIKIDFK